MVFFAAVLRIATNHCFQSSNFLRNHVNVGTRWRYFTGANPFKLTSLLTFVCILRYISFNLHQFSLHIFQCDCRSCVIYVQFLFMYFSSTSLPIHGQCLTLHSGGFRFPPKIKRGFFLTNNNTFYLNTVGFKANIAYGAV